MCHGVGHGAHGLGLADDAVLLAWMAAALVTDTEKFLAWERHPQDATGWQSWGGGPQDAPTATYQTVRSHVVG